MGYEEQHDRRAEGSDDSDDVLTVLREAFDVARRGDVARLSALLDAGVPADLTNSHGDSLLILSAYHLHAGTVALLLDRGADVERVNDNGQSALAAAVFRRNVVLVEMLLAAGAQADTGTRSAREVATFFELTDMSAVLDLHAQALRQDTPE
ncbi:ankyrin repeat domain-containing protein [Jatrophihabitans telluris]|uniref:Ankyrin repeat domain-containing protein n=1 Tax=Jatrophihabitans telluris TaxID=2038343 RepID=A0ABY4QYZ8_9ACTN|nr:ankyrin repeat domain-containing protein [Jatrophihabitans telluris]UQX88432.1 ankyrin repeat domain-containing protein [Jatrophihabitans telluris]